jgi:hypothetical protein
MHVNNVKAKCELTVMLPRVQSHHFVYLSLDELYKDACSYGWYHDQRAAVRHGRHTPRYVALSTKAYLIRLYACGRGYLERVL